MQTDGDCLIATIDSLVKIDLQAGHGDVLSVVTARMERLRKRFSASAIVPDANSQCALLNSKEKLSSRRCCQASSVSNAAPVVSRKRLRNPASLFNGRMRLPCNMAMYPFHRVGSRERKAPGKHFVKCHAERIEVAA